jgi:uncharacterized protein
MTKTTLIDSVKNGEIASVGELVRSGEDVNQQDEYGWTPLNWAAGRGDLEAVKVLLANGADLLKVGRDQRTPYMIALAAGRVEVVKYLRDEERKQGINDSPNRIERPYCKAYYLRELREFPEWSEIRMNWRDKSDEDKTDEDRRKDTIGFLDDDIVYVHQDFTVTDSIWHNENVIFHETTDMWREFCRHQLKFHVPDDLDLIVPDHVMAAAVKTESNDHVEKPAAY